MDELYIDKLSGEEFEDYLFNLFKSLGYSIIKENSNFNENLNEQIKNRYYRPNKKGKTFRICLSIIILLIISQFTIVKIDNPVVGFPVLFLIIYISFKLGSWLTNKLFKNKNS